MVALALPGSSVAHQYNLSLDGTGTTVLVSDYLPASATTTNYSVPAANLATITLAGGLLADQLTLDLSHGNPLPSGGASFDGLAATDQLILTGSLNGQSLNISATQIQVGGRSLSYSNVETLLALSNLGATGARPNVQITGGRAHYPVHANAGPTDAEYRRDVPTGCREHLPAGCQYAGV